MTQTRLPVPPAISHCKPGSPSRSSNWLRRLTRVAVMAWLSLAWPLAGQAYQGDPPPVVPPFKGDYQVTRWQALVPEDWDPYALFERLTEGRGGALPESDDTPQARELNRKLRELWDRAPTLPALDGARTRLAGYVVPLEDSQRGLKEFLLVPYYGACIHSPPPPANQIVHVVMDRPVPKLRSMDAVWVVGTLRVMRQDSEMGVSGYQLRGVGLAPYER
jgi:hypothetical protein